MKFGDRRINLYREIPSEAVSGGNFDGFFRCSLRPGVVGDVISVASVGQVGMNVPVKFGDSSSNGSRDIFSSEVVGCGIFDRF